jgi:hypothetical protein
MSRNFWKREISDFFLKPGQSARHKISHFYISSIRTLARNCFIIKSLKQMYAKSTNMKPAIGSRAGQ